MATFNIDSTPDLHIKEEEEEPDLVDMLIYDKYEFKLREHQNA